MNLRAPATLSTCYKQEGLPAQGRKSCCNYTTRTREFRDRTPTCIASFVGTQRIELCATTLSGWFPRPGGLMPVILLAYPAVTDRDPVTVISCRNKFPRDPERYKSYHQRDDNPETPSRSCVTSVTHFPSPSFLGRPAPGLRPPLFAWLACATLCAFTFMHFQASLPSTSNRVIT